MIKHLQEVLQMPAVSQYFANQAATEGRNLAADPHRAPEEALNPIRKISRPAVAASVTNPCQAFRFQARAQ
jgi:hypothetical protein